MAFRHQVYLAFLDRSYIVIEEKLVDDLELSTAIHCFDSSWLKLMPSAVDK